MGPFTTTRTNIGSDSSSSVGAGRLASGGRILPVAVRAVCGCSRAWAILRIPGWRLRSVVWAPYVSALGRVRRLGRGGAVPLASLGRWF